MDKRILIEFFGGDMDGRIMDSHSADPIECDLVRIYSQAFLKSDHPARHEISYSNLERLMRGEIAFDQVESSTVGKSASYSVVERLDTADGLLIRVRYSSRESPNQ